jgi:hypothetical protein|tara:strand:+ start:1656 stop:2015 length:360 start_codon:yes stop_codon:yes gene_type:complete
MVFFAAGIAPTVFQSLPEAEAGQFLRRLFPRYYLALILGAGVAGLCFAMTSPLAAAICFIIAGSTGWVRQVLVPRINQFRDAELNGDADAGQQFARLHRWSVGINMVQLLALLILLFRH